MRALLSRAQFHDQVFRRDRGLCVNCAQPAVDAHHILERRLWPDGGYYLDNGVAVCGRCHEQAEATTLSCDRLRALAGIPRVALPPHLDPSVAYDKWGNPYRSDGMRTPGELFYEEPVQKVLRRAGLIDQFVPYVKYPRTPHVPFSPGAGKDDRTLQDLTAFAGRDVVVTVKMDGENTSVYSDGYTHARSVDSGPHPSRDWMAAHAAAIGPQLPVGWRVCGESLYATHSIQYQELPSYFLGFSIWDDRNTCLSWDETEDWLALLDIPPVPVLYRGPFSEQALRQLPTVELHGQPMEGWVLRRADSFTLAEFGSSVAKWVRPGHVTTSSHWMSQAVRRNGLAAPPR